MNYVKLIIFNTYLSKHTFLPGYLMSFLHKTLWEMLLAEMFLGFLKWQSY
jgi:hypothetical protein